MPIAITGTVRELVQLSTDAANPQWQRGAGSLFYDIPGETNSTFTPSYEEVGVSLRVRDTVTAEVSAATIAVPEGPYVYDTFTEAGSGNATIVGHQADIGSTWIQHPAGTTGVNIDRTNDRAVGTTSSGLNFDINQQLIDTARIRVKVTNIRTGGLGSLLLGFNNANPIDGYRLFWDTNMSVHRHNNSNTGVLVGGTISFPNTTSVPNVINLTMEAHPTLTRFRWKAPNNAFTSNRDDTDANRKSPLNRYVGIGLRTGHSFDDFAVFAIDDSPLVTLDGIWTWYNDPRGLRYNDVDYITYIDSAGNNKLTKRESGVDTTVSVGVANSPVDDHNNPAVCVLPGDKLFVGYSDHLDAVGTRYKVTTNALPDISAFSSERVISVGALAYVAYVNPFVLSDGILRIIRRGATFNHQVCTAPAADVAAGTETWSIQTLANIHQMYAKFAVNADNTRLYMMWGNEHPRDANVSLYACYYDTADGNWHNLSGTVITLPMTTAQATLVRATASGDTNWSFDIQIGEDGHPRFLGCRYPSGTGISSGLSNIEYWHYRWTGSAIVATQFASNQISLYNGESYYSGGMCFDGNDATIIYASLLDSDGWYQVNELRVDETTNTITKVRNVSSRTLVHNCRPFSPKGHNGEVAVYFWRGNYTTYTSYLTELHRASGSPPVEVSDVANITSVNVTTTAPSISLSSIGQIHAFASQNIATNAPELTLSSLGGTVSVSSQNIVTSIPAISTASISQVHSLTSQGLVTAAPAIGVSGLGQRHALASVALTTAPPALSASVLGQIHGLSSLTLATGAPTLSFSAIGQKHSLASVNITTGTPLISQSSLAGESGIISTNLVTFAPSISVSSIGQRHAIASQPIVTNIPVISATVIAIIINIPSQNITTGIPAVSVSGLTQRHSLVSNNITAGVPVITQSLARIPNVIISQNIVTYPPEISIGAIGTAPSVMAGVIVIPTEIRWFYVPYENRIIVRR